MAAEPSRGSISLLSAADVKQIVHLAPCSGKELLAEKLGIAPYQDPKDQQKAPFVSFIYDNIMFAAEKGFPWSHICHVILFAHEFLKRILVENHKLSDAIQDIKENANILAPLNERHKKQYIDFVYETVLCHYNLYKYVFSHLRDSVEPKIEREVLVPPMPPPLTKGEDVVIWEYNEKLKAVDQKERAVQEELEAKKEKLSQQPPSHKTVEDLNSVPVPYSKMTLNELVKDVLAGFAEKKETELIIKADEIVNDLSLKLEKTAIERPAVLGAPPRYRMKSPLRGSKTVGIDSSLKVDKEKRGNLSAKSKSGRASAVSVSSKR